MPEEPVKRMIENDDLEEDGMLQPVAVGEKDVAEKRITYGGFHGHGDTPMEGLFQGKSYEHG